MVRNDDKDVIVGLWRFLLGITGVSSKKIGQHDRIDSILPQRDRVHLAEYLESQYGVTLDSDSEVYAAITRRELESAVLEEVRYAREKR